MGDYDVVKDVLGAEGQIQFWQVCMKPGKPLAFGLLNDGAVPLIGLPGNPVSAMVSFEQFARPAILKMLGYTGLAKPTVKAILEEPVANSGRRAFIRVLVTAGRDDITPKRRGSRAPGAYLHVEGRRPCDRPEGHFVEEGEEVTVQMLDWPEGSGT